MKYKEEIAMQLVNTHRKCMRCQTTSLDLENARCSCGAYMHLIGFVYQPAVIQQPANDFNKNKNTVACKKIGA